MPVQWYQTKKRQGAMGDFLSVSKNFLRFSREALEKYFKNMEYLAVGYDETINTIFLRPNNTSEGFKITKNIMAASPCIRWDGFTTAYSIHFDKTCSIKIKNGYQKDIFMLELKGCTHARSLFLK